MRTRLPFQVYLVGTITVVAACLFGAVQSYLAGQNWLAACLGFGAGLALIGVIIKRA